MGPNNRAPPALALALFGNQDVNPGTPVQQRTTPEPKTAARGQRLQAFRARLKERRQKQDIVVIQEQETKSQKKFENGQREIEKKRQQELERKQQKDLENKRQEGLEKERQRQLEKKRQKELELRQQQELEKKRQKELEKER